MQELRSITAAYEAGDTDSALQQVVQALSQSENNGRLWEMRGLIHWRREETDACVRALETASVLVPLGNEARIVLAEAYGRQGRVELASELLQVLLEAIDLHSPDSPAPFLLKLAHAFEAIEKPNLAMKACREAARKAPHFAQAYYELGFYAGKCGYTLNVVESLARKAISLAPDRASYRVGLASLLLRHQRCQDACQVMQSMTDEQLHQVSCCDCLERMSQLFEQSGDWKRAADCYERIEYLIANGIKSTCD